jgi:hypothetical protein
MSRGDRGRDPHTTHPAQVSVPPLRILVGTARQPTEACLAVTERAYMPPHEVCLGVVKAQQTADGLLPDLLRFPTPYGRSALCPSEHVCRQRPTLGIPHHRRVPYCGAWPRCDGLATIHASMPYVLPWADMRLSGSPHGPWHSTCLLKKKTKDSLSAGAPESISIMGRLRTNGVSVCQTK